MRIWKKMLLGATLAAYAIGIANADMVTNNIEDVLKKNLITSKPHHSKPDDEDISTPTQKNLPTDNPYLDNLLHILSLANSLHTNTVLKQFPEDENDIEKLETYEYVKKNDAAIEIFENGQFVFNYVNHKGNTIYLPDRVKIWHNNGVIAAIKIDDKIYPLQWRYLKNSKHVVTKGTPAKHRKVLEMIANEIFMNFTEYQIDVSIMLITGNTAHVDNTDKKNYLQSKVYPELMLTYK